VLLQAARRPLEVVQACLQACLQVQAWAADSWTIQISRTASEVVWEAPAAAEAVVAA
jgi:hypothetical protein